ncbi:hypothetical protein LEP1GSC016_2093 [Leptospira borgpetersenii serovar Hardjo-bovis str. Sponselee]|uniref:Uncharacterized protein n=1 Tax=Leptospira borgpetersenii serovar Hardjo-bovis str. Sponselee TaxID=1303729 RepID=M6BUY0_LEPBO|nr:hypothetical protein LEP1GSC016_2093 [Leptospira borgpetersenii serovar Hardjo-bovis str. Sponselee]
MRKNFLKGDSYSFRIVRKIVIRGIFHILRIDLQSSGSNLFQKNELWILTPNPR